MDQLKQYWEIAKKQHFWILCGLAVLVPLVVFWVASGKLAAAYTEQKTKISSVNSGLDPLKAGDHPNPEWVNHVKSETEKLRGNVLAAWDALYKQQQGLLKWPAELGPDFIAAFSKPASSDDPRALEPFCERYQSYVEIEVSHMADLINAEWAPGDINGHSARRPSRPGAPDAAAEEARKTYFVEWNPSDEAQWYKYYNWANTPSPTAVRYAQEELWVMKAIFEAISRTNAGATGDFDARVRGVDRILVGYDATDRYPLAEGSGRLSHVRSTQSGPAIRGAVIEAPAGPPPTAALEPKRPMPNEDAPHGPPTAGVPGVPAGPADPDARLKEGRYVDSKGKALAASELANSTTPEYNLMAFKLNIQADEQRWQKLLVELCNSPLPLEVREVRIDPQGGEAGREQGPRRERPQRNQNNGGASNTIHNVTIEIYGVAYLMNPPNLAKLGIAAGALPDASAAPLPAAPPVAPAATSPPATAPAATTPPATGAATPTPPATPATPAPATGVPATGASPTPAAPTAPAPPTGAAPAAIGPAATGPAATGPAATGPAATPTTTPATTPPTATPPATTPLATPPAAPSNK